MFIFIPLFTIFTLLFGGYLAKRIGILKQKQARMFLDFAIIFALPCLIFDRVYHIDFDFSLLLFIFIGFCSSIISGCIAVILGYFLKFSKITILSIFLLSSFGNTLFIGLPIISGIYTDTQYIGEVILYDSFATNIPIAFIAPFVLSFANNEKIYFLSIVKKILLSPPFMALVLGFVLKLVEIPEFIFRPITMFGNSATVVALFAIGLSLGFGAIKSSYKAATIVILSKNIISPLLFMLIIFLFDIQYSPSLIVVVLESAMPTMTLACAIVIKSKLDSNLAVSSLAFGILCTGITMPVLVYFLLN